MNPWRGNERPPDSSSHYEGAVAFATLVVVLVLMVLWSRQWP
jgi:hypothetical protein